MVFPARAQCDRLRLAGAKLGPSLCDQGEGGKSARIRAEGERADHEQPPISCCALPGGRLKLEDIETESLVPGEIAALKDLAKIFRVSTTELADRLRDAGSAADWPEFESRGAAEGRACPGAPRLTRWLVIACSPLGRSHLPSPKDPVADAPEVDPRPVKEVLQAWLTRRDGASVVARLPVLAYEAAGGAGLAFVPVAAAWQATYLAAKLIDDVKDGDLAGHVGEMTDTATVPLLVARAALDLLPSLLSPAAARSVHCSLNRAVLRACIAYQAFDWRGRGHTWCRSRYLAANRGWKIRRTAGQGGLGGRARGGLRSDRGDSLPPLWVSSGYPSPGGLLVHWCRHRRPISAASRCGVLLFGGGSARCGRPCDGRV